MPSKYFWIGFVIANVFWIAALSYITIPEYTVIQQIECKRNMT